ncbi:thioredoxin family protein [Tellurirhabdus bombi]|uniref:thioredoxin family protein n=1 Tax=Tellurirhabdus bombi TaxID=2907205 RepID=UPI001F2AA032|nr:thioredoxin family protein [Tellurirhabdus bombi]
MKTKWVFSLLAVLLMSATQVETPVLGRTAAYTIGEVVADFRLKNTNGQQVALSDYRTSKGVIVIFTSNHCPFAKAYEDRIIALDRKYAPQGVPVVAIQPNDPAAYEDDSFENMKARAADKGYSFPYLLDETQEVAKAFGATRTPHAYLLKRTGDRFVVEYIGTLDDSPQDAGSVKRRYMEEALNSLLTGRPVVTTITKAVGCAIKWKGL